MIANIIVAAIVIAAVGFAVYKVIKNRKKGGCGCGCSGSCDDCCGRASFKEEK